MRRLVVVAFVGCAQPASVAAVSVAPPPVASAHEVHATLLSGCVVVGTGQRRREPLDALDEPIPFEVFTSPETREAAFVIAKPESTHVVWSRFPSRADHGRAHVAVGGQRHLRYGGWAELYGRTFTTTRRMESSAGHVWAHAGAPVEVMAERDGVVYARVATGFAAPKTVVVQGNCADLRYAPEEPAHRARRVAAPLVNRDTSLRLFSSPTSGTPFTMITLARPHALAVEAVDRRDGFVRVSIDRPYVGFDAWIPEAQLESAAAESVASPAEEPMPDRTPRRSVRARVPRDTPLFTGFEPELLEGAVVEAGAEILYDPRLETTVSGRTIVAFEFADGSFAARAGGRLWIAKDAILQ